MKTFWLIIFIILSSFCFGVLIGKQMYSFEPIRLILPSYPVVIMNRCLTEEQVKEASKYGLIEFVVYPGGKIKVNNK